MIEFTATTHPGNRYQHNEDAIGWSERAGIWFVADGIGGHARGDLASATVKKTLLAAASGHERSLTELVMLAHEAVLLEGIEQSLTNMGSTLVLARVRDDQLNVAWCGDSRAYLWRADKLVRLTRDHSLLEQLLESGLVAPEEAFGHPRRNVLVQALGINEPGPEPGEITLTLDNDDLVILCSDGVHDELHDNTISDVLRAMSGTQAVVDELERRVLTTDARDNLSIICLKASGLRHRERQPLDVATVQRDVQTLQRSLSTTRQRVVDTQKLPTALESAGPELNKAISGSTSAAAVSAAADSAPRVAPTRRAGENTTSDSSASSNVFGSSSTELWLALAVIGLLVALVLFFT